MKGFAAVIYLDIQMVRLADGPVVVHTLRVANAVLR
jgi:hypothetical protein